MKNKKKRAAPQTCTTCGRGKLIVTGTTVRCSRCTFENIVKNGKHIVVDDESFQTSS